jgi:hypothetical protein
LKTKEKQKENLKKKGIIQSLKMERLIFSPFFPIVKELHHLHKAMGRGSISPWHMQQWTSSSSATR